MDKIILKDIQVETIIGLLDEEAHAPQRLVLSIEAHCDFSRIQQTDSLSDGIDYCQLVHAAREFAASFEGKTLEYFANSLALHLKQTYHLGGIVLEVSKPKYVEALGLGDIIIRVER